MSLATMSNWRRWFVAGFGALGVYESVVGLLSGSTADDTQRSAATVCAALPFSTGSATGAFVVALVCFSLVAWVYMSPNICGTVIRLRRWRRDPSPPPTLLTYQLVPMTCPRCEGNGRDWGIYERPCKMCCATGEVPAKIASFDRCKLCEGTGRAYAVHERPCEACHGYGHRIPKPNADELNYYFYHERGIA